MKNKRRHYKPSRLDRIEHKCNVILSQLILIRQLIKEQPTELDRTIDRLHQSARRLRVESEAERDCLTRLFNSL